MKRVRMTETKKIFIGVCNSQSRIPSDFFWSVIGQEDFVAQPVLTRTIHPYPPIRNNQLLDGFLKSDCDYFVKMDIDQKYPPDYFKVMVPLIEKYKIIGPLIFDRLPVWDFMPLVNWYDQEHKSLLPHFELKGKSGIWKVPYLHTNCFFHREAIEAVPQPHYEVHVRGDGLAKDNHVDITFMQKFVAAGYDIYVNLDVVVEHIAEVPVSREVHEIWNRGLERGVECSVI